jgi:hypothetical protein
MKLKIAPAEARSLLYSIPHDICKTGVEPRWKVNEDGDVPAQSVLWLFCGAKTGMGSNQAAHAATRVFDNLFSVRYDKFDLAVDHARARRMRYAVGDIEHTLAAQLVACGIDLQDRTHPALVPMTSARPEKSA